MSLLSEIQRDAIDEKSNISELFRKCKVLAFRLGNEDFKTWVEHELDGYPEKSTVPEYRVFRIESFGNFIGIGWSKYNNTPIPPSAIREEHRDLIKYLYFFDSIGSLASLIEGKKDNETLDISWPGDVLAYYRDKIFKGWQCTLAWKAVSISSVISILNNVRSRLLSFVLELEKEAPDIGENTQQQVDDELLQRNFNMIIMGNVTNLVASSEQTITYNTKVTINQYDFESLKQFLQSNGVPEKDIELLEEAIREDGKYDARKGFGNKVKSWLGHMINKAISGSWKITAPAAANLLTHSLLKYFGAG